MSVLVLAEKPSVAKSIAAVLGASTRKDGFYIGAGYIVSWCIGHLVEMAKPEMYDARYAKWRREDLPILPDKFQMTVPKDKAKQLKVIAGLFARPDVDIIVCATDAGREGELIFRLVYEHCKCTKPIQRLWISSMEDAAIREGFEDLRDGAEYDKLHQAALCRMGADWIIGMNATRLFSVLYGATLNIGRVMTPVLALLAKREDAITAFKKEPWYMVELDFPLDSTAGFVAAGTKHREMNSAEDLRASCEGQPVSVQSVERLQKTEKPPRLYDLTTLQREANRIFDYTAQQTLDYLQSLYEKKLATYPRTDSRFLTEDMAATAGSIVNYLQLHMPFSQGTAYTPNMARVIDNAKVSDHHAIIPTMQLAGTDFDTLLTGERNVLMLICVRLLCATAEPHTYEAVTAMLECGGNTFTAKGKTVLRNGWKAIERAFWGTIKERPEKEDAPPLPSLDEGQNLGMAKATVKEGFTSPPRPYSEDTLLSAMENAGAEDMPDDIERKGLGTPATRAATIEKLVKSGMVQRAKKQLRPTAKGLNLIAVVPDMLKSPALTAEWEEKLKLVERGEISAEEFMKGIAQMTQALVQNHTTAAPEYAGLFAPSKGQAEPVGVCPRCGSAVVERSKGYFCEKQGCGFALWKNDRFFTGKGKKLDKKTAAALLKDGKAKVTGFTARNNSKKFNATVVMDDTGKYINYRLDFSVK